MSKEAIREQLRPLDNLRKCSSRDRITTDARQYKRAQPTTVGHVKTPFAALENIWEEDS